MEREGEVCVCGGGGGEAETRRERRESSPIVLKAAKQEEEGDTEQESETVNLFFTIFKLRVSSFVSLKTDRD